MSSLTKADVYRVVLSKEGFRAIADENTKDESTFHVLFIDGVTIQNAIKASRFGHVTYPFS